MEEWRNIPGWEGVYAVSSAGRVKSLARVSRNGRGPINLREKILAPHLNNGYPRVTLANPSSGNVKEYVHRLVCLAFHGPRPPGCEVAHNDGNRLNPDAENVRWATRLENIRDKPLHGKQPRGADIWMSKLTEQDIRAIRKSSEPQRVLGSRYGVTPGHISLIRNRKTWAHVKD